MTEANPFASPLGGTASRASAMTWPRWRLVLLLMAICFLAHFNRVSMAIAADLRIMDEYAITPTAMGAVYSAFLIAYTALMIPGGWLIDRFGPRFALGLVALGSATFVALTGCVGLGASSAAGALAALVAIRALMGVVSAPLHPAAAKAVSIGIPFAARSAANGLVTGAALLGVASTYLLFGGAIELVGWPGAFITAAAATAAVGWLWLRWVPPEPSRQRTQPLDSDATVFVKGEPPSHASSEFLSVLHNRNLFLLTMSYAAVGYFQYLFFYWMHYYFESVLDLGAEPSRIYSTIPPLAMAAAMPLGGLLADRLQDALGPTAARRSIAMTAMAASAGLLLAGTWATEPVWIVTWLSLALGSLGLAEGPFWVTAVEVGGRRGGASAAVFNTGGNAGGILSPLVTPWLSDTLGLGWQTGIAAGSAVCLLGALAWCWIDLQPPDESGQL